MRRFGCTALALAAGSIVFTAGPAFAHVLKIDGDIAAVLHINPDDNPTSGVPTTFVLAFDDTTNRFRLPQCSCMVTIEENGQTIYSHPLAVTSSLGSVDNVTFPKPDVYTLVVSGTPKPPRAFQSFRLSYIVRVESGAAHTQRFPVLLGIGQVFMIALILLGAYKSEYNASNRR